MTDGFGVGHRRDLSGKFISDSVTPRIFFLGGGLVEKSVNFLPVLSRKKTDETVPHFLQHPPPHSDKFGEEI